MCWSLAGSRKPLRYTGLAGGQRPPLLDCSGGRVFGGRPKAAIEIAALTVGGRPKGALACCLLILALAFRKSTVPSKHFKRSFPVATQQKAFVFRFRLARLWRALISSIYIYISINLSCQRQMFRSGPLRMGYKRGCTFCWGAFGTLRENTI